MSTYLKNFCKFSNKGVAYLPIGTIEWHGNHLPIETDFLVAQKICEILSQKVSGYVLPPIYLGTDKEGSIRGKKFAGMDRRLKKKLPGSLYFLKPNFLYKLLENLGRNLKEQKFKKVFIITGHAGSKHIEILSKVAKKEKNLYLMNPYAKLELMSGHAAEDETSLFWACYPEEQRRGKKIKISESDDFLKFQGYDPRKKASLIRGQKILKEMINNCLKEIKQAMRK